MTVDTLIVVFGALAGGFVSGLTGFGTGLTALPIWLLVLAPIQAGALVVICSIVGQMQVLPAMWHAIDWRRVAPFIAGGVLGVPIGTVTLAYISADVFRLGVGVVLTTYCSIALLARHIPAVSFGGKLADSIVGLAGGVLGGIAGLSGVLPTLWTGLRGWNKTERRAVFQSFNLVILSLALVALVSTGLVGAEILTSVATALPATFIGVWAGHRVYRQLPDVRYNQIVLVLLMIAGTTMILTSAV